MIRKWTLGTPSSNSITNYKEQVNAISLRSGKEVRHPQKAMAEPRMREKKKQVAESHMEVLQDRVAEQPK